MRTAGIFIALLGATSFLFPLINMRSRIMGVFGEHERIAAIVALAAGGALILVSFLRGRKKEERK